MSDSNVFLDDSEITFDRWTYLSLCSTLLRLEHDRPGLIQEVLPRAKDIASQISPSGCRLIQWPWDQAGQFQAMECAFVPILRSLGEEELFPEGDGYYCPLLTSFSNGFPNLLAELNLWVDAGMEGWKVMASSRLDDLVLSFFWEHADVSEQMNCLPRTLRRVVIRSYLDKDVSSQLLKHMHSFSTQNITRIDFGSHDQSVHDEWEESLPSQVDEIGPRFFMAKMISNLFEAW